MPKATTARRILPFILLIVEILAFFGWFGWFLGAWERPAYPHESNLQFAVLLFYGSGILTFIFFVVVLPPSIITERKSFIRTAAIFIVIAGPSLFFSQALTDMLQHNRPTYTNALSEVWSYRRGMLLALALHFLGFLAAVAVRKTLNLFYQPKGKLPFNEP